MKRLAALSLAGIVLAVVGCDGADSRDAAAPPIPGAVVAPSPAAAVAPKARRKPGVRGGLQRAAGPLSRPSSD